MAEKPTYEELEKRIQELEQIESLMIKERNRAQQYFDVAEVMLICLDSNQNITQINKRGCEILEYTANEVIGENWFDNFIPKKNIEKIKKLFEKMMSDEKVSNEYYENSILAKSGNEKIISWHNSIIKDDSGHVISIITSGEDITERKQVADALKRSEEKFRTAFKTSPNVITLTSLKDGIYIEINDAFTKLLGYSQNEIIGESSLVLNIWNDLKDRDLLVAGLKKNGIVENLEAEFKGKTGQIINGLMSARILDIKNKKYLLAVTQDITEKKAAEEEKINARKIIADQKRLALVGQIAGRMAHDFNNILATDCRKNGP